MQITKQDSPERHSKSAQKAIHIRGFCVCHQKFACVLIVCAVSRHGPRSGNLKPQDPSVLGQEATWHRVPNYLFPLPFPNYS